MKLLIVVDMQNDFIDGALGTPEAAAIVPRVVEKIKTFDGKVLATKDTHGEDYMKTQEGRKLPVPHCIKGTEGWELHPEIAALIEDEAFEKKSFGSRCLAKVLKSYHDKDEAIESITLIGLCTDICVISNAMLLKVFLPEVEIIVDSQCCAGVTPESHLRALEAMQVCQITVE
ncbi:MAG: isochorismatase family cysteine hydrolase [Schaedlerella sp.]|nr:isochorismatase family cysteine hydrolase [Schaedlerella sp.]